MKKTILPNVLVLATTFPRWKNDTEPAFVFHLSRRLASEGFNMVILVPAAPGALLYEKIDGLKIYRFLYFYPKRLQKICYDGGALPNLKNGWLAKIELPFFLLSQFIHIGWIIKKEKIGMIHCHWIVPQGFFSAIFKKIFNLPLILSAHAGDVFALKNYLIKLCGKFTISKSDFCATNSKATLKALLDISNKKEVDIIPMGVDLNDYSSEKYDPLLKNKYEIKGPFLLAVGRFVEKKGFKYLIDAMPMIIDKYPNTKLLIIGFGPEEKKLKMHVKEQNLESSILFPGKKPAGELSKYFATADIFVGPSIVSKDGDTEGLGVVFLEALASKTAVVASDVGGISDIVIHGKTGLLVEQKNSKDIFEKVNFLLSNNQLRDSLIEEGYAIVKKHYSWQKIQKKYAEVYKNVINKANDINFKKVMP